jgi:hypothetical protein
MVHVWVLPIRAEFDIEFTAGNAVMLVVPGDSL